MNVILLGSGGREHALAWKLSQSKRVENLFIAPGNPGTSSCGHNINISPTDFASLAEFAMANQVEMIVVGPEEPLVKGVYDYFSNDESLMHIAVIGPSKTGAQLEGSKAFAKRFMERHNIPTAAYREFDASNLEEGIDYLSNQPMPIVLKADGLAAGKGVVICQTVEEAQSELKAMIAEAKFGDASAKVVIEQFLTGIEFSVFVLTDGKNFVLLPEAKDYKRIGEGDTGLNTGGMGAVSPVPIFNEALKEKTLESVVVPTIQGLLKEGITYKGFIYFGLINVNGAPFVIEYNCRMGDPETEAVMPRLKNDLGELFQAVASGTLNSVNVEYDERAAVTIVLAAGGYPGAYQKEIPIIGVDASPDSIVFHAGTKLIDDTLVTNGGRVMAITSYGESITDALNKSKRKAESIQFQGKYFRRDIGYEFL